MESTVQVKQSETGTWKSWTLTNAVQYWLADPNTNYGVILWTPDEDLDGYDMRFRSSEHTNKPKLEVVWSNQPKTVYFLRDHLGSVRAMVLDSAGAPVVSYDDYDPWGYILENRTKTRTWGDNQAIAENKFTGKERDEEHSLNWDFFGARYYDAEIGRWMVRDPLEIKYPSLSPYNYVGNNPMVFLDPDGLDWFYYQAEGEEEKSWHYHKGKTATYTNTKGKKVTAKNGFEYLVKFTVTGKNREGAETGKLEVFKQDERVVNAEGAFAGGGPLDFKPTPEGTYMMRLDVRDASGPQAMNERRNNPVAHWGIQLIPNRYLEQEGIIYDVGGAYGGGRIRLNQVDANLRIFANQREGYYLHGKLNEGINYTHGCVCDKSEVVFNYFWSGPGKQFTMRVPFWVKKQ